MSKAEHSPDAFPETAEAARLRAISENVAEWLRIDRLPKGDMKEDAIRDAQIAYDALDEDERRKVNTLVQAELKRLRSAS
jgi:hypothetical protein